ncbi:MAG: ComEC/Rec2 family competence protein [Ilumatobacteraceae bacterium]|nr:ComEC/Rec2 family competence protein [Ilumatobacteraceae bacterium]
MHTGTAIGDGVVVGLAAAVAGAVATRSPVGAIALAGLVVGALLVCRQPRVALIAVVLIPVAAERSDRAWAGLRPHTLGPFAGLVRVVDDPQPFGSATRVLIEVDGERFEVWARAFSQQMRVDGWQAGERVVVVGERIELQPDRVSRVAWQHVVGEFALDWSGDAHAGSAIARSTNRVRDLIGDASSVIPTPLGALYRGLVIGDDRDQPRVMIDRFRATGLSHLTAVSGQNVAFVLLAAGVLLRRLSPWPRLVATVLLIAWFVALTRFEPSILRAGVMAGFSALAFTTGGERSSVRLLAWAVIALLLIDPLLAWSIGFWLSVGATLGVCALTRPLQRLFRGPAWWAGSLAITLGAQVGVAVPAVLVFGRLPLVSVPANLLAGPVAGAVMLFGLPAGLLAGALPPVAPAVMAPITAGTAWVDAVSRVAVHLEPADPWPWIGWAILMFVLAVRVLRRPRGLADENLDR